mmetsp:Transcript_37501/g.51846  ORF Transcript_37501/g.51846 Transcript_37501/m.51846 type:complete len:231 (+) Transcript_37501:744-1436(+)
MEHSRFKLTMIDKPSTKYQFAITIWFVINKLTRKFVSVIPHNFPLSVLPVILKLPFVSIVTSRNPQSAPIGQTTRPMPKVRVTSIIPTSPKTGLQAIIKETLIFIAMKSISSKTSGHSITKPPLKCCGVMERILSITNREFRIQVCKRNIWNPRIDLQFSHLLLCCFDFTFHLIFPVSLQVFVNCFRKVGNPVCTFSHLLLFIKLESKLKTRDKDIKLVRNTITCHPDQV